MYPQGFYIRWSVRGNSLWKLTVIPPVRAEISERFFDTGQGPVLGFRVLRAALRLHVLVFSTAN